MDFGGSSTDEIPSENKRISKTISIAVISIVYLVLACFFLILIMGDYTQLLEIDGDVLYGYLMQTGMIVSTMNVWKLFLLYLIGYKIHLCYSDEPEERICSKCGHERNRCTGPSNENGKNSNAASSNLPNDQADDPNDSQRGFDMQGDSAQPEESHPQDDSQSSGSSIQDDLQRDLDHEDLEQLDGSQDGSQPGSATDSQDGSQPGSATDSQDGSQPGSATDSQDGSQPGSADSQGSSQPGSASGSQDGSPHEYPRRLGPKLFDYMTNVPEFAPVSQTDLSFDSRKFGEAQFLQESEVTLEVQPEHYNAPSTSYSRQPLYARHSLRSTTQDSLTSSVSMRLRVIPKSSQQEQPERGHGSKMKRKR